MYSFELRKIKKRDEKSDDKGSWIESNVLKNKYNAGVKGDRLANQIADARRISSEGLKKEKSIPDALKTVVTILIIMFGAPYTLMILMVVGSILSASASFVISGICFILGVVITINSEKTFKAVSKGKNVSGSIGALIAMALATLVLLINPVSDIYYYAAVIVVLITLMFTLIDLIRYYNMLATRKLPQFDEYKGGNDNA